MEQQTTSNWKIWKVFWILLALTSVEVFLGISKPDFLHGTQFLGTSLLNHTFIVMTLIKAAYIVMAFMHLGHEKKTLKLAILVPIFILIPYLFFLILIEGGYMFSIR
jgi:cytochrome c oxidase subunit IV